MLSTLPSSFRTTLEDTLCVPIKPWASLAVLLMGMVSLSCNATTLLGMDIDDIAREAELIFEGMVLVTEARQESNSGIISTYVTFQISDVIKGDYDADSVELKFMGGSINGEVVAVSGLTIPQQGERGIYFVESLNRDLINPLLGWSQGHFLIVDEAGIPRISTVDSEPVTAVDSVANIPSVIKKPQAIIQESNEVAAGVTTESSSLLIERALTVDQFKGRIRELLAN